MESPQRGSKMAAISLELTQVNAFEDPCTTPRRSDSDDGTHNNINVPFRNERYDVRSSEQSTSIELCADIFPVFRSHTV